MVKHRQTAQPAIERRPRGRSGTSSSNGTNSNNSNNGNSGNGGNTNGGNNSRSESNAAQNTAAPAGVEAPKGSNGTHGITEDAKHALALIAASTITHTGSIPVVAAGARTEPTSETQGAAVAKAPVDAPPASVVETESESVEILDIPVRKSQRNKRPVSKQVTDQLLDSVLEALPEPKQPVKGVRAAAG